MTAVSYYYLISAILGSTDQECLFGSTRCCLVPGNGARTPFISVTSDAPHRKTCGIQLLWKLTVRLPSSVTTGWKKCLLATRKYCSQHHNRTVISLLYSSSYFPTLLFFKPLNLGEICGFVGRAALLLRNSYTHSTVCLSMKWAAKKGTF